MPTYLDYAAVSAIAYNDSRGGQNVRSLPPSWTKIGSTASAGSDFAAQAYQNGNDIVISYQGTNFYSSFRDASGNIDWSRVWSIGSDFLLGNIAALGAGGQRLLEGAQFYQQAKAKQFTANLGRRYA